MVLTALRRFLSAYGYHVEAFAEAQDFLAVASNSEAICLLLDIQLGKASGLDVARRLAVIGFCRPIIFMTGSGDEEIRGQCLDLGCVAFLQKPIPESELIDAIVAALQVRRAIRKVAPI